MKDWGSKRYWIVGASAGLGREVARQVSQMGAEVVLSARNEDELNALAAELSGKSHVVPMDISSDESVAEAVKAAGHVDGLVFLAGVYWSFGSAAWEPENAVRMVDINLTGAFRVLGHVVPTMVERDSGHIVFTGSLSGFRGLPKAIGYGASKAGLMSLAESMYADLRKTGVQVQLINPGFVKTRLTDKNEYKMPFLMEPEYAAREFVEHMGTDRFAKNYPTLFSSGIRFTQFLPDWIYYRVFA